MDIRCDVAVIGSGPAGSTAARALARAGVDVVLADRASFPRDKVCGDALLPDAVQALEESGLTEAVGRAALAVPRIVVRSPSGASVGLGGTFLTCPREQLDAVLLEGARAVGVRFVPGFTATEPSHDASGLTGVVGRFDGERPARISCRAVVLATGSSPRVLEAFGVLRRARHSAIAIRGYVPNDLFLEGEDPALFVSYERTLLPGYGWSFPVPGGMWNIGCGVIIRESRLKAAGADGAASIETNLRALLARFVGTSAVARGSAPPGSSARLPDEAWWRSVRGATLRTGFAGSDPVRGQVLVAGESLGLTLPLTGDGIGKAMQSGLIAAASLVSALAKNAGALDLSGYAATLEARLRNVYRAYDTAQRWIGVPIVPDLLIRRARRSARLKRLLEEIVAETTDPRLVLSPLGLVRAAIL